MIVNGPRRASRKSASTAGDDRARAKSKTSSSPGQARELQRRLGDDAERALAADEELAEIEAGVVLLERAVELEHLARSRARPRARAPTAA